MVASIVGTALSLIAAGILALLTVHYRDSIKQDESRKVLSERLLHPSYFGLLKVCLDWLERRFGPAMGFRPFRFGGKGFGVCLFLSQCYAFASFTIGWGLGAPGTLGEIHIFRDAGFLAESWPRSVRGIVLLLLLVVLFLFFRWMFHWMDRKLSVWVATRRGKRQRVLLLRSSIMVVGTAIFVAVFGTVFVIGTEFVVGVSAYAVLAVVFVVFAVVFVGARAGVGFDAGEGARVVVGAVVGAVIVVVVGAVFGAGARADRVIVIILFLLLLPLLNAFWDWGSLSLSRWLGREILDKKSATMALRLVIVDLIAAVGFLVSLAIVLPFFAGVFESFMSVSLDIEGYLEVAAANPWTEGFWATFMLFSTLLPTAAHFAVALFSALPCAGRISWRETLKHKIDSGIEANYLIPALYFSFWWMVSIGLVGLGGWGLSWVLVTGDIPVAETLLEIARWSLALSGPPSF